MFGAPMRLPIDLLRGEPPDIPSHLKSSGAYKDYLLKLRQHLWKIHKEVRDNLQWTARKMKESYDKTANYISF